MTDVAFDRKETRPRLRHAVRLGLAGLALIGFAVASHAKTRTDLLRRLTDESSSAGQAGDQATVDRLTNPMVLFSAGDGLVQRDEKLDASDSVSTQLKTWTVALHGPANGPSRSVVAAEPMFVDETGAGNARGDFTGGPATLEDWVCHHGPDVAVTSFILAAPHARVRAVEVWNRQASGWKLVAGQTIPLNTDPPTMDVPASVLQAYVGAFSAGPGSLVHITLGPEGLSLVGQDGKASALKPASQDRFFTPGLPSGYLRPSTRFSRDAGGAATGFTRNGIVYRRTDAATAAGPAPTPGPLKLRDFQVRTFGSVAVATFFHDRDTPYFGQTLRQTFRSMEAWINADGRWTMISSQGRQIERDL